MVKPLKKSMWTISIKKGVPKRVFCDAALRNYFLHHLCKGVRGEFRKGKTIPGKLKS
jgi:hypothetical protein